MSDDRVHNLMEKIFPYLDTVETPEKDLLSILAVLQLNPSELSTLRKAEDTEPNPDVYKSQYLTVYHLISHSDKLSIAERMSNTFRALMYTYLLEEKTDFLYEMEPELKSFIPQLILRFMESFPFNAIGQSQWDEERQKPISYARAILPSISLCNHSCDPNAVPVTMTGSSCKTAILAMKPLKPGDEIRISYKPIFYMQNHPDRFEFLKRSFYFECACEPCVKGWEMPDRELDFRFVKPEYLLNKNGAKRKTKKSKLEHEYLKQLEEELQDIKEEVEKRENLVQNLQKVSDILNNLYTQYNSLLPLAQVAQHLFKRILVFIIVGYNSCANS